MTEKFTRMNKKAFEKYISDLNDADEKTKKFFENVKQSSFLSMATAKIITDQKSMPLIKPKKRKTTDSEGNVVMQELPEGLSRLELYHFEYLEKVYDFPFEICKKSVMEFRKFINKKIAVLEKKDFLGIKSSLSMKYGELYTDKDNNLNLPEFYQGSAGSFNFIDISKNKLVVVDKKGTEIDATILINKIKQQLSKGNNQTLIELPNFAYDNPGRRAGEDMTTPGGIQRLAAAMQREMKYNGYKKISVKPPLTTLYSKMKTNGTNSEFYEAEEGFHPFSKLPSFWNNYENSERQAKKRNR